MAKYRLDENLQPTKEGKRLYHARFVPDYTVREEELLESVTERTALTSADMKAALDILRKLLVQWLRAGHNVELEGIGTFSVVLTHRPIEDKRKIRAESIDFRDVTFRSSAKLRRELKGLPLTRVESPEPSRLTDEERERRMLDYLAGHPYITGRVYERLNECGRTKASAELRRMVAEGKLRREAFGRVWLYKLAGEPGE